MPYMQIVPYTCHVYFQAVHTFLSWGSRVESLPSPRCCHCQQYQAFVIFSSNLWFYQREHTGVSINLFTVSASKASKWALKTQSQLSQTLKMVRRQWRTRVYVDLAAKRGGSLPIALVGVEISSRQCLPNWFAWFMVLVSYLLIYHTPQHQNRQKNKKITFWSPGEECWAGFINQQRFSDNCCQKLLPRQKGWSHCCPKYNMMITLPLLLTTNHCQKLLPRPKRSKYSYCCMKQLPQMPTNCHEEKDYHYWIVTWNLLEFFNNIFEYLDSGNHCSMW